MSGSGEGGLPADDDARERAVRTFVMAIALTPIILFPSVTGSVGEISAETALLAGLGGVVVGVPAFLALERVDFSHVNDVVALVAMLALSGVSRHVVWPRFTAESG